MTIFVISTLNNEKKKRKKIECIPCPSVPFPCKQLRFKQPEIQETFSKPNLRFEIIQYPAVS